MHTRRSILSIALLLVLAVGIQAQDIFKLKVDVPVVSLESIVTDSKGVPQTDLRQKDFEIYEDDQLQEIRYYGAALTPRTVLLVFDVTGVMEKQGPFMVQAVQVFLSHMREQDRVGFGVMGPEFEMLMDFRKVEQGKPIDVKIPKERFGSNLYSSLDMAARRFNKEKGRKAIIALTDGRDTGMFNETQRLGKVAELTDDDQFKKHLADAAKRGVPYYFIALDTDPRYITGIDMEYAFFKNPDGYMRSPLFANGRRSPRIAEEYLEGVRRRMEKLAEATGGRVIYPRAMSEVVGLFNQVSLELGYAYSLGYSPKTPPDGKEHRIEVRVKDTSMRVSQSRKTYGGAEATIK